MTRNAENYPSKPGLLHPTGEVPNISDGASEMAPMSFAYRAEEERVSVLRERVVEIVRERGLRQFPEPVRLASGESSHDLANQGQPTLSPWTEELNSETWVGLAHVGEKQGTGSLGGRPGAYVNVLCWAESRSEFLDKALRYLHSRGFDVWEVEDVEPVRSRQEREELDPAFIELARQTELSRGAMLDTVFRYLSD